LAIALGANQ